mgnify:CR=1 FL=1
MTNGANSFHLQLREELENYIKSQYLGKSPLLLSALSNKISECGELYQEPYIESSPAYQTELNGIQKAVLPEWIKDFFKKLSDAKLGVFPSPFQHQIQALEAAVSGKDLFVSTGTGSGKTECYLYPIFNEIMREKEAGTLGDGVRALLIFPMNALANDQQKKLRKLLKDYPDITFGRYTGETPHIGKKETPDQAEERLHNEYDQQHTYDTDPSLRKSIPNEFMSREKMVNNPPHILLTNYAMLEMLLLRPDTSPFFDNESAKNWKFIIMITL